MTAENLHQIPWSGSTESLHFNLGKYANINSGEAKDVYLKALSLIDTSYTTPNSNEHQYIRTTLVLISSSIILLLVITVIDLETTQTHPFFK